MAKVETPKSSPEKIARVEARANKRENLPKQKESGVNTLQEFLTQIKLFSLLKKIDPENTNFEKIKQLELQLSSSDKLERAEAREKIDLFANKISEAQADSSKPLAEVVDLVFGPESSGKPPRLNDLVNEISSQNLLISEKLASNIKISKEELSTFEGNLVELKEVMGISDETREGLAEMSETLMRAQELRKVRRYMENPRVYESPLLKKIDFFEEGASENGNEHKMIIRNAKKSKRANLESHLETVKRHVRDELINENGKKLKELDGEDLLDRLEDLSDLKARSRNLVGSDHKKLVETLEVLTVAEAQYQVALEDRIRGDLKANKLQFNDLAVSEATRQILSEARDVSSPAGRARYKFNTSYEGVAKRVYAESRKLEAGGYATPMIDGADKEAYEDALEQYGAGRSRDVTLRQKGNELKVFFAEVNIDVGATLEKMAKITGADEGEKFQKRLKFAKQVEGTFPPGLDASRVKMMSQFLESAASNEKFLGVQVKLKEYVRDGKFGEYLVELKAYIARIGLRETSADFEFAFLLRDAKDVISRYEPDIADEFDGWQSSLFIPPVKSVSPEMYRSIFEKVWGAGNLDHVFNPGYANAEAMSININGTRKNVSTAVFYQLLQQTENSNKLLNAKVNSSDSTMFGVLVEYLYGKGTKIEGMGDLSKAKIIGADGTLLFDAGRGDVFDVQYFDLVSKNLQEGAKRSLVLSEMLDQATWMERYAINFWSYSGEAGNHYRHYPKEDMENANKWLFAQDQMFEGYSGHFGKYDPPFWEIAKLTHMLREIRSYKDGSIIKGATIEALEKSGIGGKRAVEIAELFNNKLTKKMKIDDKSFKVGLLTLEDARLIGNNYSNPIESWTAKGQDWLAAHGTPREMIMNSSQMKDILDRRARGVALSDLEKDWAIQADEFFALCKDLKWTAAEKAIVDTITEAELKPLADKVSTIFGTEWKPKNASEFMENFEYASVMDLGKYAQGSDPTEYAQKYMKLAEEVAKKLPQIQKGVATSKEILELQTAMRAYLTPEEVDAFFEILTRKTILTHTFQTNKYEIAKLNDDQRTINYKKMKDDNGHVYYFVGRDGHRIANTETYRGAYFNRKYGTKTWRQSDVETLLDAMKGQAMLPRSIAESMLDDLVGGGRTIDRIFKNFGIDTKKSKGAKLFKAALARSKRLIGRLPLFDDPAWAAWSLTAELVNFVGEAAKEITKTVVK